MSNATKVKQLQGTTVGSVLFIGAGGHVTEDNAQLFWDDTNNRLGIGTASPSAKLHVNGSVRLQGLTTTPAAGYVLQSTDALGNADWVLPAGADGNGIYTGSGTVPNGTVATLTGIFRIDNATGQAVSFGTTNTIFNPATLNIDFIVRGDTDNNLLFIDASIDTVAIGSVPASNTKLSINTTNSTQLRALDVENATYSGTFATGINSTAYSTLSQYNTGVQGVAYGGTVENWGVRGIASSSTTINKGILGEVNAINAANNYAGYFTTQNTGAGSAYGIYVDTTAGASRFGIVVNRGTSIFNEAGDDYDFRVEGDTDPNLLFIDASTDSVGIGTASPSSKLHIVNSITDFSLIVTNTKATAVTKRGMLVSVTGTAGSGGTQGINVGVTGAIGTIDGIRITNTSTGTSGYGVWSQVTGATSSGNVGVVGSANGATSFNFGIAGVAGQSGSGPSSTGMDAGITAQIKGTRNGGACAWVYNLSQTTGTTYGIKHIDFFNIASQVQYGYHMILDKICTNNTGLFINVSGATSVNTAITTEQGGVIFNEAGTDSDFRVEGDTDPNLLFVDASMDMVGIGTVIPAAKLDINGSVATRANTPAAIVANTNDYAIPAFSFIRISSSGAFNITGLANGVNGRQITLVNVGANTITLTHQDALSVAANRMINKGGLSIVLVADAVATFIYDATTARWRHTGGTT